MAEWPARGERPWDDKLKAYVDEEISESGEEALYAVEREVRPRSVVDVTYPAPETTPRAVGCTDGVLWGSLGTQLHRSEDGETWSVIGSVVTGAAGIQRVATTADGEVLVAGTRMIYRSTGWATNPSTATWTVVWQTPDVDTFLAPFSMDFNDPSGQTFVTSHYTGEVPLWPKSRYVWVSRDAGLTWTVVYDSVELYGEAPAAESHVHGVCYDSWGDRLWVSEGHETVCGLRWSDDNGETWTKITKGEVGGLTMAPTTLVATPTGICCGSDSLENGAYGVARVTNSEDLALEWLWQWRTTSGWGGSAGFGQGGWYDPATELAYISYQTGYADVDPPIVLGNGVSASPIMTVPTDAAVRTIYAAFATPHGIVAASDIPGRQRILARISGSADPSVAQVDRGGVLGGEAQSVRSVAVGLDAAVEGFAREAVALGTSARVVTDAHKSVAVGYGSVAGQQRSTVVGAGSATSGTDSVAVGTGAKASSVSTALGAGVDLSARIYSTALGASAAVGGDESVAVGTSATATAGLSVVVGAFAASANERTVAIGYQATSGQQRSVVIGEGATAAANGSSIGSVVVGRGGSASAHASVVIGTAASAGTDASVALGALAQAGHSGAVAVGYNTATTHVDQVALGARHIELSEVGDPEEPAANSTRLYTRDNGAGKSQLCVRFASGAVQVIATEP